MKLRHLSVKNFRGIGNLEWAIPERRLICLIGKGDSTKSSVLDAMRLLLNPSWNPTIDPFDFQNGDTTKAIVITGVLGQLPQEFLSDAKYGLSLQGWDKDTGQLYDEPGDALEEVISVQFSVNNELQPKWRVTTSRDEEGPNFPPADRARASASFIGVYADRQLSWGRNTILSKATELESIADSLSSATYAARDALDQKRDSDLKAFDKTAQSVEVIARKYGVPVSKEGAYKAQLDTSTLNIQQGGLTLHDDEIPLRTLGLGSRRLLAMGIEQQGLATPHITMIDEVEFGLEPHRITRLLKNLTEEENGQYFITTHSAVVLRHLTVVNLFVVQYSEQIVSIKPTQISGFEEVIQGKIRSGAECFLGKSVIVCEGATEIGICKGLETHWLGKGSDPFAFTGTNLFDAKGGSNVRAAAEAFQSLGYRVAVIVDSDAETNFSEADKVNLIALGIHVTYWDGHRAIEEYFFDHLPWPLVLRSVALAIELRGESVTDQLKNADPNLAIDRSEWLDTPDVRKAIGQASLGNSKGQNAWFKRQSLAEKWMDSIVSETAQGTTELNRKFLSLEEWAKNGTA